MSRGYKKQNPLAVVVAAYESPLLFAHGYVPQYMVAPAFDKPPDVDDFIVRGQVTRDRRVYTIVTTFPFHDLNQKSWDEYWVDTERDCAVVRQLAYVNDKPRIDLVLQP